MTTSCKEISGRERSEPPGQLITGSARVHRAWWVAVAAALTLISAGAFSALPGLLVLPLHAEFGWSRGSIGVAGWINMASGGLIAPFAAALMDRFGIRRVATGALMLAGAGAALTTVMTSPWQWALYWGLLVGLGCGSLAMAFAATVTHRWFARRRGLVTGLLTAASVFGQFAFLPALSRIIDRYQWRSALGTLAVTALVALTLLWLLLRDHPADVGLRPYGATEFTPRPLPVPGAGRRAVVVLVRAARTGPFWMLAITFAICGASTNGIMWTHFAPAAHDHGMPVTAAATLLSMIGIFNVLGTVSSGWLTDRVAARLLLAGYYAFRGISLLVLPLLLGPGPSVPLVSFVVVFGLLDVATVPPTIALCREAYGDDGAVVFGWVLAAHQIGAGVMAFAGGTVRDLLGSYDLVWPATGVLCLLAAAGLSRRVFRSARPLVRAPWPLLPRGSLRERA